MTRRDSEGARVNISGSNEWREWKASHCFGQAEEKRRNAIEEATGIKCEGCDILIRLKTSGRWLCDECHYLERDHSNPRF